MDEEDNFRIYDAIRQMIHIYCADNETLDKKEKCWKNTFAHELIVGNELELLPIPVMTQVNPKNTHEFFVHVVLSLGRYVTQIDVLCYPSPRKRFQKAGIIGPETNEDHLQ